ncbi:MAG: hypothetical protein K8R36_18140 [Planctomycetales bacterium]|nr:hypothetical protein [Planctomycetales bacterium]
MQLHLLLAQAQSGEAGVYYQLARFQSLTEWWHPMVLGLICLFIVGYVIFMYVKDSVELTVSYAMVLVLLRILAFGGILFFFFNLEKRAERILVKNSRAIMLVDTSQSMALRDADSPGGSSASSTGRSRIEQVIGELEKGEFVESLRQKHDVVVYRFDQTENPVEIASFPKKAPLPDASKSATAEESLLAALREARIIAMVAGGLLGISLLAGLIHLIFGRGRKQAKAQRQGQEGGSWALLVSVVLLISSVVVLAVANLRRPEINLLAIVGLSEPELEKPDKPAGMNDEAKEQKTVDWKEQLLPKGAETRIGDNLKFLIDKERGGPIAGIILCSDGGSNAGLSYEIAAGDANNALIPVYPIGLGSDQRPVNVRVVDLEAPERVYPGDKFTLTGYIQAINSSRTSLTVELLSGDKDGKGEVKEDEQTLAVGNTGKIVPVKFEHTPKDQGVRTFRLRVQTVEGELDKKDNEKTAKVEIVDRKTRILLFASGPAREFIFLRNQLFRDKEVTVDVLLQSGRPGISQEAHDILTKFPESADELFEYDCIVGFDPDWEALDDLQVKNLERWVAEKAGGLIVVAGPVCTPSWTARRRGDPRIDAIKALYPVVFYNQSSATLSLGRFGGDKPWPLTFTRDGMEAEFLWIDEDAEKSQRARDEFAGVYGYYAVKDPKPGARVYARFSDPDTAIDNILPIYMAGHFYGSGRVFFQASGEMWRIRELDEKYFETYYTKLIRWASEGRLLRDSARGVLLVDKDRCLIGDQVGVRAILQDSQFQPLALPEVSAVLIRPDQKRTPFLLKRVKDAAREGMYAEQFTALQEGDYRIELQHPNAADQLMVREVRAKMPAQETEHPERNDQLLKTLADRTGGKYYVGFNAAVKPTTGEPGVVGELKAQDQATPLPGTPDRKFEQLLMTWLMGLICGVLCLEWLLRRLSKLA